MEEQHGNAIVDALNQLKEGDSKLYSDFLKFDPDFVIRSTIKFYSEFPSGFRMEEDMGENGNLIRVINDTFEGTEQNGKKEIIAENLSKVRPNNYLGKIEYLADSIVYEGIAWIPSARGIADNLSKKVSMRLGQAKRLEKLKELLLTS
jgi:hypothetical protein